MPVYTIAFGTDNGAITNPDTGQIDPVPVKLDELQGAAMLRGVRGAKPVDESALVDTIMKVQRLALDLADDIAELDVNPLVVRSRGAVALDALVVRK